MAHFGVRRGVLICAAVAAACGPIELDVSGSRDLSLGQVCTTEGTCAVPLVCAPADDGAARCARAIELHGHVRDAVTDAPVPDAHVTALDASGVPVGLVAVTDADGNFVLPADVVRDETTAPVSGATVTLYVAAAGYRPFPDGPRQAFPVTIHDAAAGSFDTEASEPFVVSSPATVVELIASPFAPGAAVSGRIDGGDPAGALVVAAGASVPAPYAVADRNGNFTIFNVMPGTVTLQAYRQGAAFVPRQVVASGADLEGIVLAVDPGGSLTSLEGSLTIVNAPGGSATSVVLIPNEVYDEAFERGPAPLGLRAPPPPAAPNVSGAFVIDGVAPGTYRVLAGFENDGIVRDPDESISGTQVPTVEVDGIQPVVLTDAFKMTAALELVTPSPGGPQELDPVPTFEWIDDSGESHYAIEVVDALGNLAWSEPMSPGFSGGGPVSAIYEGPALTAGMYYQLRVTAVKAGPQGDTALTRSEDLLGVFVVR